jgi:uncharacterized membrane protein
MCPGPGGRTRATSATMTLMPRHETSVQVAAPLETVWAVTYAIESWPSWSPTMTSVTRSDSGPLRPGGSARVRQPKLRPATWVVDVADENHNFTWHTSGPGYSISAAHLLEPADVGTSVLLRVEATGPLASLVWLLAGRTAIRYVEQEAAALKRACEVPA